MREVKSKSKIYFKSLIREYPIHFRNIDYFWIFITYFSNDIEIATPT